MKKFLTVVAVIAAISMLTLSASALTAVVDGNTINLVVGADGDVDGIIVVSGPDVARVIGQNGVLAVHNPENGNLVIAGLGLEAGDDIVSIRFDGDVGTVSFEGTGGQFAGMTTITATLGGGDQIIDDIIVEETVVEETVVEETVEEEEEEEHPKGGVALAIVPAIVAAAAVAITRKRK
jgi:hypothetical protein